jgi:hypothetical protein
MMRACLVLSERPISLRVASFKAENVELIVKDWKPITAAIDSAVDLLVAWGFQGETLPSVNAVIPIAYAIRRGCDIKSSNADLRLLLMKNLLTGVFGSSGDQVLSGIRNAMKDVKPGDYFKLAAFEKTVHLPGGKSIAITEDTLDDLLLTTKGPRTFALLSLLMPNLKFSQVQFHQDHIHPYANFNANALRKLKLGDDEIADWQAKRDALPNLHLLEGKENQQKKATPFDAWLKAECPTDIGRTNYLRSHHIPDVSLGLNEFTAFCEKRRELLKQQLVKLLNVQIKTAHAPGAGNEEEEPLNAEHTGMSVAEKRTRSGAVTSARRRGIGYRALKGLVAKPISRTNLIAGLIAAGLTESTAKKLHSMVVHAGCN